MVERIANVFGVHPAVLYLTPGEDVLANWLEQHRDLPKNELKKKFHELLMRGYRPSKGLA